MADDTFIRIPIDQLGAKILQESPGLEVLFLNQLTKHENMSKLASKWFMERFPGQYDILVPMLNDHDNVYLLFKTEEDKIQWKLTYL